jgi:hypothetical protein
VPGAFDETIETAEPTETTEATVTESPETDDTVERTETDRIRDPSEQLLEELISRMPEIEVPASTEVKPTKFIPFNVDKLEQRNIRRWKNRIEMILESQGCWTVVEHTYNWRNDGPKIKKLMEDQGWKSQDATARIYILQSLKPEDETSVQGIKTSGGIWAYLMEKYERRTDVDVTIAIDQMLQWKMDPQIGLEEAMQRLEEHHSELIDISNGEIKFNQKVIIILFLRGLPQEYEPIKYSLLAQGDLTRGMVLSRLKQQESLMRAAKASEGASESANRTQQRKCFNCGKPGHFQRNCRAPKEGRGAEQL